MMDKERRLLMISVAAVIAVVILACAWDVVQAKMESETYNRLTGANTTWWDALWVELRVMESPKR